LKASPQTFKLLMVDASTDATGVNEPTIRIVVAEQKRPQSRTRAFRIGPADHHELLAVQAFHF